MLYQTNQELPLEIRFCLSEAAQDLYRVAYNCAIHSYGNPAKARKIVASAHLMHSTKNYTVFV